MAKLYIEYRVYFNPQTNQDLLREVAEAGKDRIFDMFDMDAEGQPIPSPHDVTYEIVMEIDECKPLNLTQADARLERKNG